MSKFKVGDKVKVVNATHGWGNVEQGDIGVIVTVSSGEYFVHFNKQEGWLATESDLVLAESNSELDLILLENKVKEQQKEIDEVKEQLETVLSQLGNIKSSNDFSIGIIEQLKNKKSQKQEDVDKDNINNYQRAKIIQEAKDFVKEHTTPNTRDKEWNKKGAVKGFKNLYRSSCMIPYFTHNFINRTSTLALKGAGDGKIHEKYTIKCLSEDVYNEDIAKAILIGKAKGLDVSKFENAPQPTHYAIGQIVQRYDKPIDSKYKYKVVKIGEYENTLKMLFDKKSFAHCDTEKSLGYEDKTIKSLKVVNDTNAKYEV